MLSSPILWDYTFKLLVDDIKEIVISFLNNRALCLSSDL